jgi:hypothetical protein
LRRNRSIVVDLFHGQLRSQVKCKTCGHVSARFDPFNFLSLPLPMDNSMHLEIIGEPYNAVYTVLQFNIQKIFHETSKITIILEIFVSGCLSPVHPFLCSPQSFTVTVWF